MPSGSANVFHVRSNPPIWRSSAKVSSQAWHSGHLILRACGLIEMKSTEGKIDCRDIPSDWDALWICTISGLAHLKKLHHQHPLDEGRVALITPPSDERIFVATPDTPWRFVYVAMAGNFAGEGVAYLHRRFGSIHSLPADSEPIRLALRLARFIREDPVRNPDFWAIKTYEWLNEWWKTAEKSTAPLAVSLEASRPELIAVGAKTIQHLAHQIGYSPSHLSRKLKKVWQVAPGAALRTAKLQEAAQLLLTTKLPASDIGEKVGYQAPSSFCRAFARKFGMSPINYRLEGGKKIRKEAKGKKRL